MSRPTPEECVDFVYGNEDEKRVFLQQTDTILGPEPRQVTKLVPFESPRYLTPHEVAFPGHDRTLNGFRIYAGLQDSVAPEVATPECLKIDDVVRSVRVGSFMVKLAAVRYLEEFGAADGYSGVYIGQRTVDTKGKTRGCHDNFGMHWSVVPSTEEIARYLPSFLVTMPIVSGTGWARGDGYYHLSQKNHDIHYISQPGYVSRYYRYAPLQSADETHPRIEVSNAEVSLSDWALRQRFAAVSSLLALVAVHAFEDLNKILPRYDEESLMEKGATGNIISIAPSDTELALGSTARLLAARQRAISELFVQEFGDVEAAQEHVRLAIDRIEYIDRVMNVADGKLPLSELFGTSDWATKLHLIRQTIERQRERGVEIPYDDLRVSRIDYAYDEWEATLDDIGIVSVREGTAERLVGKNKFVEQLDRQEIIDNWRNVPVGRSQAVTCLMKSCLGKNLKQIGWSKLLIELGPMKKLQTLMLLDPTDSMPAEVASILNTA